MNGQDEEDLMFACLRGLQPRRPLGLQPSPQQQYYRPTGDGVSSCSSTTGAGGVAFLFLNFFGGILSTRMKLHCRAGLLYTLTDRARRVRP